MGQIKNVSTLHPYCQECQKKRVADKDGPLDKITKVPIYKKGDFIVKCRGIPKDYNFIPNFEKIKHKLTPEEIEYSKELYDPILWAKKHLDWEPRASKDGLEYQGLIARCTSKRKILRMGRRSGKSDVIAVLILHYMFTNNPESKRWDKNQKKWVKGFSTILFLAPYLSQVKLVFDRITEFLDKNPDLNAEVKRKVATPFHSIELYSGVKIVMFPSGAKSGAGAESVRGQKADFIILDEMDYLNEKDLETIMALLMEHGDVNLLCASTPSGKREYFWRFCVERPDFKEFHFTALVNPQWNDDLERELRMFYKTEIGWDHEVMANFGEQMEGVFQIKFVDQALTEYKMIDQKPEPGWIYSIGTDWNDTKNGCKICVVGFDTNSKVFRKVDVATIQKQGFQQLTAVSTIVDMNRRWKPAFIYVDAGYGTTQIELIKKFGVEAQYSKLATARVDSNLMKVKAIDFGSVIEVFDPFTGEPRKLPMKPYMISNAVSKFEQLQVQISKDDDDLYKQLIGYIVARVTVKGSPVYEAGPDGDHDLDAFVLALLAFSVELSEFTNVDHSATIAFAGNLGDKNLDSEMIMSNLEKRDPNVEAFKKKKEKSPSLPTERVPDTKAMNNIQGFGLPALLSMRNRIYTPEAFRSDRMDSGYPGQKLWKRVKPQRKGF